MTEKLEENEKDPLVKVDDVASLIKFRSFKRFSKNIPALISAIFLILAILVSIFPSKITGYSQNVQNLDLQ